MSRPEVYTEEELTQALRDRQAGRTLKEYAEEISLSFQMLSQVLNGSRSISNEKVLEFLAPRGMKYVKKNVYELVKK